MVNDSGRSNEMQRGFGKQRPNDDSTTPKNLTVRIEEQRLIIDWLDGERSEYSLDDLRQLCPCASCRTRREQQDANPLKVLAFDPNRVRVTHAELVGAYAIRFEWSDGHNTGIFDFRYLRSLTAKQ